MQTQNKPKTPATAKGWSVSNILAEFKRHASTGFDIERLRHEYLIPAIASHAKDIVNGTIAADDKEIKNTLNALVTIVQNAQLEELKAQGFDVDQKPLEALEPDKILQIDYTDRHGNPFSYEDTPIGLRSRLAELEKREQDSRESNETGNVRFKFDAEAAAIRKTLRMYGAPPFRYGRPLNAKDMEVTK